jgi:hypothetical protein
MSTPPNLLAWLQEQQKAGINKVILPVEDVIAAITRQPAAPISLEQIKALETAVCNGQSGEALRLLHHMRNALAAPSVEQDERGALDVSVLARLSAQIFDCPLNPTISKFARAVEANIRAASTSANVAQGAEASETCRCQRLGDWKGFHHPLCDKAQAAQTALTDEATSVTAAMPGTDAWTVAVFASHVAPVGTLVYLKARP